MHFTIEQEDAITIFRLKESRLDSMNASALKAEFLILAQPDVETLIVDLSEVSYVDSAGLSALLLAQRQQSAHNGDVRLVGANENVASLLRLTQLDRIFPVYPTIEAAIEDAEVEEKPVAAGAGALKMGAIAAGGSFGAAALASLMMDRSGDDDPLASLGDEEFDDDEFEDDDFDEEDDLDDEDDLEDDAEEVEEPKPTDEEIEPDVIVEDVDLEDFEDDLDDDDDDDDLADDDIF